MKRAVLFLWILAGCNGGPPGPPPCVESPLCSATGGAWDEASCACACPSGFVFLEDEGCQPVSPPPPPPPPAAKGCDTPVGLRERGDYIPTARADYWERELAAYDQRLIWNGIRNPAFALEHCPEGSPRSVWPYNGVDADTARGTLGRAREAREALVGADGESRYAAPGRFSDPNRRCQDDGDPWCGRSNVYRPCFLETWREVRTITDGCLDAQCEDFHPPTAPRGIAALLDGVAGACRATGGL